MFLLFFLLLNLFIDLFPITFFLNIDKTYIVHTFFHFFLLLLEFVNIYFLSFFFFNFYFICSFIVFRKQIFNVIFLRIKIFVVFLILFVVVVFFMVLNHNLDYVEITTSRIRQCNINQNSRRNSKY